ncbi:MAG: PIG-L deacetylase family protein [Candidatus Bathyarchaeia archaeon]|jgi:LmbE family N-acetylglucosaminyl deacetylase
MVVVVAIGAHPDDVEGGCFGTLAKYKKAGNDIVIMLLTKGGRGGDKLVRESEASEAASVINAKLIVGDFEDGMVRDDSETVQWIEKQLKRVKADKVFFMCVNDNHQDHRNVGRAAIAASRDINNVLMYETSSTTEFNPQMFVDIGDTLKDKILALSKHESVQKSGYSAGEVVTNLAKYRAYQLRQYGKVVEAFQVVRWSLNIE